MSIVTETVSRTAAGVNVGSKGSGNDAKSALSDIQRFRQHGTTAQRPKAHLY